MATAVLQARMSSSRLPGKVLRPLLGQPMILRQIERLRRCRRLDRIVVVAGLRVVPSLDEPHAAASSDVDGGVEDHGQRAGWRRLRRRRRKETGGEGFEGCEGKMGQGA